ncbi:MAG: translesion error-prone DNA polymerase V autoproteolytic subunit [Pseudomonadota bacterium]
MKKLSNVRLPLCSSSVAAGFPSPAEDYIEGKLDLNEHLIKHPAATFFVKVAGDSMTGAGIFDGDLLVVDRSLEAENGSVVLAVVGGEFTVKRLKKGKGGILLLPENPKHRPIEVREGMEFSIWGVVVHVIHRLA